uniref:Uncharacterized protein n=1 Tax=Oryza punctata TaxID=4537 RepID=A0A0E0MI55_ORYPU
MADRLRHYGFCPWKVILPPPPVLQYISGQDVVAVALCEAKLRQQQWTHEKSEAQRHLCP